MPVIAVPEQELTLGELAEGETYRVAILPEAGRSGAADGEAAASREQPPADERSAPPVTEGDTLEVEIEDVGDQGDGLVRIGPGYVVFVPETTVGDRVTIEITDTRENFAFAEVVEPEPVSD